MKAPRARLSRRSQPLAAASASASAGVADRELGERTQTLALRRRPFELPRQLRQRPPPRPAADIVRVEQHGDLVPEGARLARVPLVGRRLADEHQPPARACARGVEEVAVALDRIGPDEACARSAVEVPARLVVEEGRGIAPARQRALLEPEQEDDLEAACPCTGEVEHRHTTSVAGRAEADLGVLERAEHLVGRELAAEIAPALELVQQAGDGVVGAQVCAARIADGRRLHAMRAAQHRRGQRAHGLDRPGCAPHRLEHGQRLPVAQLDRLLLHGLPRRDAPPTQPAFEKVDIRAHDARERCAQERVEVAAAPLLPLEAKQGEQRLAERRLAEPHTPLDRERNPERAENGLDRRPPALDRRHDQGNFVERYVRRRQVANLLGDELERSASARALEEPDCTLERRAGGRLVGEEVALEMGEGCVTVLARPRR